MEEEKKAPKLTGREAYRNRLKERYPEREYADDDALAEQAMSDYDEYDGKIKDLEGQVKGHADAAKKLTEMFDKDPQSASFMMGMANGTSFLDNLYANYGEYMPEAFKDPEVRERLSAEHQQKLERVAENKKLEDEFEKNMEESLQQISRIQDEKGMTPEEMQAAMDIVEKIASEYLVGKISPDTIELCVKGCNADADIANARREGEVEGRNSKIDEKLRKQNRQQDGVPSLGGASGNGAPAMHMGGRNKKKSVWDNSGYTRNTYE